MFQIQYRFLMSPCVEESTICNLKTAPPLPAIIAVLIRLGRKNFLTNYGIFGKNVWCFSRCIRNPSRPGGFYATCIYKKWEVSSRFFNLFILNPLFWLVVYLILNNHTISIQPIRTNRKQKNILNCRVIIFSTDMMMQWFKCNIEPSKTTV